jgi:hypothetical protein
MDFCSLKGRSSSGPCNNPFFGASYAIQTPLAPVNTVPGPRVRTAFGNHAFIGAQSSFGIVILDATSGPHIGNENLATYLTNAIDHGTWVRLYNMSHFEQVSLVTNYYAVNPSYGPGTAADINPNHTGIVTTTGILPASPASVTDVEGSVEDPVDKAMELAKVKDADPPRFSQVDPTGLKSLLESKAEMKLTLKDVDPRAKGSEAFWLFGNRPKAVEVTLFAADSHNTAVQAMRDKLTVVSAPLDTLFISTLRLGQRTLQGLGGRGFILFVRGNIFVQLLGLSSSEELGKVAVSVD